MTMSSDSTHAHLRTREMLAKQAAVNTNQSDHDGKPDCGAFYIDKGSRSFRLDVYTYDATPDSTCTVPESAMKTFLDLCNRAFSGRQHEKNFGPHKLRYPSTDALRQDIVLASGGWVFLLYEKMGQEESPAHAKWAPAACAKITVDGKGMDGGVGIHEVTVHQEDTFPASTSPPQATYWLGALGSGRPGAGSVLLNGVQRFLSSRHPDKAFQIRAYSVHSWGIGENWALPASSPLLEWFARQGFVVYAYSWKPPGTWGCFYGACLADLRSVYTIQS